MINYGGHMEKSLMASILITVIEQDRNDNSDDVIGNKQKAL